MIEAIKDILKKHNGNLDYESIHENEDIRRWIYSLIKIEVEGSPFDYIEEIDVNEKGEVVAGIFVEPVGALTFKASSLESLFEGINDLFNRQPDDMGYAVAGHTIFAYARNVRKGFGIDFNFLDTDLLWGIDINEEKNERNLSFDEVKQGRDLFDFVKQKNRVNFVVTDDMVLFTDGVAESMLGEIIHVEEQMPDFFKLIIDLSKFASFNEEIMKLANDSDFFKSSYPKNGIIEHYISYDCDINNDTGFKLMEESEIEFYKKEAKKFWELDYDGTYEEYLEDSK